MKSQHLGTKFMRDNLNLVEPVQFNLKSNTAISSYQYVPILESIRAFCKNHEVLDYIMSGPPCTPGNVLTDIQHGSIFQDNPVFQISPNIQILLYFDEFMAFNPLRGNQSKLKLAAFYFTLCNIPYKYRSTVKDMQLALLCRSADLKMFGFETILEPQIKDLKTLENDGIIISDVPCSIKGSIVAIVGDNLAAHQIGGYVTCFAGNSLCCQFCLGTNSDFQTCFTDSLFVSRTKQLHSQHLSLVNIDQTYSSAYGLKFNSPFNSLKYFHTSDSLPPDAMHDFLEGVVPLELGLILNHLIIKKYFTLAQLNYKIKKSKFGYHDSANKPIETSDTYAKGIKMSASRM